MIYSLDEWCWMVISISFIGFLIENIWLFFRKKYIDNRSMFFPFLFGYGIAIVIVYFLFNTPPVEKLSHFYYFIKLIIGVSIGEITLGMLVEKICKVYYWDYSKIPFHITRYTNIFTSIGFAIIIDFIMKYIFNNIMEFIKLNMNIFLSFSGRFIVIILFIDMIHSFIYMYKNKKIYKLWKIDFNNINLKKIFIINK